MTGLHIASEIEQAKREVLDAIELLAAYAEDRAVSEDALTAAALARSFVLSERTPMSPLSSRRRVDAGTPVPATSAQGGPSTRTSTTAAGQGNPNMTRYYIAPDAENEPSVWVEGADPDLPIALVRRCDVTPETWSLIVLGVDAQAAGERAEDCVEAMHMHVSICQRAGYRNGRLDAADLDLVQEPPC